MLTDTFTVKTVDGASQVVTIEITGANDAAVIGTPSVADVTEDVGASTAGELIATGRIAVSDADQSLGSFRTSVTGVSGNLGSLVLAADGSNTPTVDTFTVTSLNGTTKQVSFISGLDEGGRSTSPILASVAR